ncbi:MAG: hypothetical protein M3O28_15370 [Actinomycetota bacterium]|nr:hypothetical protein [Actinomycetota bacterium]
MSWTWRMESVDGAAMVGPASPAHSNQSDAESWLGENWRELAEAGVGQVVLLHGVTEVYGPMPLSPD